jgi:hypothetical protein
VRPALSSFFPGPLFFFPSELTFTSAVTPTSGGTSLIISRRFSSFLTPSSAEA